MDAEHAKAQRAMAIIEGLESFIGRGAGTDVERRAANWLGGRCSGAGHQVLTETFWCRPNWAMAHLWHVALAVIGTLVSLASPVTGIVLLAIALASTVSDAITGMSLGRRLTSERASQNVVVSPAGDRRPPQTTRLILTANYDAGRTGIAYRSAIRTVTARLSSGLRGVTPGWLGWLTLGIVWLLVVAILRQTGHTSHVVGAVQFPPTVGLVLAFALLLEVATGEWSPAAGDSGSGIAAVLALAEELTTAAPRNLEVEVVLTGAGDGEQIGLWRYLRARRAAPRTLRAWRGLRHPRRGERQADAIVLGIAACGAGTPRFWQSDGAFLPLRYSSSLRRLATDIAADERHLEIRPHRGRGSTGAFAARAAGLPALTIGCLDDGDVPPRSHQRTDVAAAIDRQSLDRTIQFALLLVDAIDTAVGEAGAAANPTPA